jgi:hypothetical protein
MTIPPMLKRGFNLPDESPAQLPPPIGPFATAALSTALSVALLVVMRAGLKISLMSVLWIIIPTLTVATMLIAVSMAWIFVSIGRNKRQPRWVAGTAVLIAITMIAILIATYVTESQP